MHTELQQSGLVCSLRNPDTRKHKYTGKQLLRTDDTIDDNRQKIKGNIILRNHVETSISVGSTKNIVHIEKFYFNTFWSSDSAHTGFRGFGVRWQFLWKMKFESNRTNWRLLDMSYRHHLYHFTRDRIIWKLVEGHHTTDVGTEINIAHGIISGIWTEFLWTGMWASRGKVVFVLRKPRRIGKLSCQAKLTCALVANHFLSATGKRISPKKVVRCL